MRFHPKHAIIAAAGVAVGSGSSALLIALLHQGDMTPALAEVLDMFKTAFLCSTTALVALLGGRRR